MINQSPNKLLFLLVINLFSSSHILSHDRRAPDPKALCAIVCLGSIAMTLKGFELAMLATKSSKDLTSPTFLFSDDTPIERLSEASALSKREFFEAQARKVDILKKTATTDQIAHEFIEIRPGRSNFDRYAPADLFNTDIQRYQTPKNIKDITKNRLRRANQLASNRNNGGRGR